MLAPRKQAALLLSALLVFGVGPWVSRAAAPASNVIRVQKGFVTQIGPWNARRDSSLGAAIEAFGIPSSVRYDGPGACRAYWSSRRISALFYYRDETQRARTRCGHVGRLDWFITGSPSWRTNAGLRVGDATSRVRSLYPTSALRKDRLWVLTRGQIGETEEDSVRTTEAEPSGGQVKSLRAWFLED